MEAISPRHPDPLVVLLPSVHWRHEGLANVLTALSLQSVPAAHVHVFLDGWNDEPEIPSELNVTLHENTTGLGAWARWLFIETLPPEQLVATMDDDMAIAPWHIERAVAAYHAMGRGILSWGGHDRDFERVWYNNDYENEIPLVRPMAGITMFRARDLQGMTTSNQSLIAKDSPEEAVIAACAWQRRLPLIRPPGKSGLSALKTAFDRRCNYHQHRFRWAYYFQRAAQLTDWPHGIRLAQLYGPPPQ